MVLLLGESGYLGDSAQEKLISGFVWTTAYSITIKTYISQR